MDKYCLIKITLSDGSLSFNTVVDVIENVLSLDKNTLLSRTRKREIVFGRWLLYDYLYKATNDSIMDISRRLKQNHATIIHGLNEINSNFLLKRQRKLKELFEQNIDELHKKFNLDTIYEK